MVHAIYRLSQSSTKRDKALWDCVAFVSEGYIKGNEGENDGRVKDRNCNHCGHPWEEHLHIDYKVIESSRIIEDPDVKRALDQNETEIEIKKVGIQSKENIVAELKDTSNRIRDAAARFSVFLKKNSIATYNDATLEYLDQLIKEEQGKVSVGGSRENLDFLEQYRAEYEERIQVLEENLSQGNVHDELDQKGAERLMQELYELPYCGQLFKKNEKAIQQQRVQPREMIYHMKTHEKWFRNRGKGILGFLKNPWGS